MTENDFARLDIKLGHRRKLQRRIHTERHTVNAAQVPDICEMSVLSSNKRKSSEDHEQSRAQPIVPILDSEDGSEVPESPLSR
jgi:hypothetical protein